MVVDAWSGGLQRPCLGLSDFASFAQDYAGGWERFVSSSRLLSREQRESLGNRGVSEDSLHSQPCCLHSHPSPAEHVEVLQELQRLQRRLQPFLQRYCEVLGAAATTDYNNNVSL